MSCCSVESSRDFDTLPSPLLLNGMHDSWQYECVAASQPEGGPLWAG